MTSQPDDIPVVAFNEHLSFRESGALAAIEDLLGGLDAHQRESVLYILNSHWLEGIAPTRRVVRDVVARANNET